jgi:hypothetical protein
MKENIVLKITFKEDLLKQNDYEIMYTKGNIDKLKLPKLDKTMVYYLKDMSEFPEVIGYFNLDEIESIQFK